MSTQVSTYGGEGLIIQVTMSEQAAMVIWEGTSDSRDPAAAFAPLLKQLSEDRRKNVTLDFRKLSFMNSASVSPIIQLVKALNAAEVPTTLVYDTSVAWQRINCECMQVLATRLPHVV